MLSPKEISSITLVGTLDGEPVNEIRTIGGLFVIAGIPRGKNKPEALAAASHGAIAKYNVKKQFGNRFVPSLEKNESQPEPIVNDRSPFLSKENIKNGFKLYTVRNPEKVQAILTHSKQGKQIVCYEALTKAEALEIKSEMEITDIELGQKLESISSSILRAFAEEAIIMKKEFVHLQETVKKARAIDLRKA